ncbi:MAG: DegV family protein [Candidatus Izimaplasma sp.]|nr:DegV family protein [Candidatus Izimaplasma bacterium]
MKKLGLIIDSTVYLKQDVIDENDIDVVSLNVVDGKESFKELDINNKFVYERQDQGSTLTTSQPAPGEFLEAYQRKIKAGYEKIFVICVSKDISGTYQSATLAQNMLDDPEKVHIFDTQLAAYGTEMIAIEVIDMMKANKTDTEIINKTEQIIATSEQMFTVENLFSLVKGGRLSAAKAMIGTVLRVKPIVRMMDGQLKLVNSERTYKKLHKYMVNEVEKSLEGHSKVTFYLTSKNSDDSAEKLKEVLKERFPDAKMTETAYLGPVFTIHVGKKGYGISYFVE